MDFRKMAPKYAAIASKRCLQQSRTLSKINLVGWVSYPGVCRVY